MGGYRFIQFVFLFLSFVLFTSQMASEDVNYICPLIDIATTKDGITTHNITRSLHCENGRRMAGCCVDRFYCNYNTSHIDLTMYGPPGYRMSCDKYMCCPREYILPIPLSNDTRKNDDDRSTSDSGDDSSDDRDD